MGTRRSRHNRGRKPFYKDHERTTLADIVPSETEGWEAEAEEFLHNRRSNALREASYHRGNGGFLAARIGKPDPELTESVKAYLARRQAAQARHEADLIFPDVHQSPERVKRFEFSREADCVEPSRRDVLIDLFVERKITHGQMHAGRRWQADKEWATLQPSRSIRWSGSRAFYYQARGTLTSSQWAAMKRRRSFVEAEGISASTFLDFCLEADRGRTELVEMTGIPVASLECAIEDLLTKLCRHFGR